MKHFHRHLVLGLLLALCLTLFALPVSAAPVGYDIPGGKLLFDLNTGTVTGYDGEITDVVIPGEIYGVSVTAIKSGAFKDCRTLTSVTFPDTITTIGSSAFARCGELTGIYLPDSVTVVEHGAFAACSAMTNVRLSPNMTELSDSVLQHCTSLESLDIPEKITKIGRFALANTGFIRITLPDTVVSVDDFAFASCEQLTYIDFGQISDLGQLVVETCNDLREIRLSPNLTVLKGSVFNRCGLETVTIPEGITEIDDMAFWMCEDLREIHLPSTLKAVGNATFGSCDSITDVYYNGTVTDWAAVSVGGANEKMLNATFHFSQPVAGFTDVGTNDYYGDAVQWAVNAGVTTGTSATTFSPDAAVTRAQAVTFLWRAAGSPEPASGTSPFVDVADPAVYYYKPVLWAVQQGITAGTSATTFSPNTAVVYDQMLTFLCRAAGASASGSDWSAAALQWAADNGLTDGLSFAAKDACPRCDVVYCLWRQLG